MGILNRLLAAFEAARLRPTIRDPSRPPPDLAEVELTVIEVLRDEMGVPDAKIHLDARLTNLAHCDDLSFVFCTEVRNRLGVVVPVEAWSSVWTVRDAIQLLDGCIVRSETAESGNAPE